jgi:hypothetical protein
MATAVQASLCTMTDLNALSKPKAAVRSSRAESNQKSRCLTAFHCFPDLPPELQDEVWKWASYASPNIINIMIDDEVVQFIATALIVPAILHVTSGSRGIALRHYTLAENSEFDREHHRAQQQQPQPQPQPLQLQPHLLQQQAQLPNLPFLPGGNHHHHHHAAGPRRPIPAPVSGKTMPRYFYYNTAGDIFHLQIGTAADHIFPTFILPPFGQPGVVRSDRCLTEVERQSEISRLNHGGFVAPSFPHTGKIPAFFKNIKHLALNFSLPTCPHPYSSRLYKNWVETEIQKFLDGHVKTTTGHFEALRSIDLLVKKDHGIGKKPSVQKSDFKDWRDVSIRESDGITFGQLELAYIESEIRMWFMREHLGKTNGALEWRLVVKVPDSNRTN